MTPMGGSATTKPTTSRWHSRRIANVLGLDRETVDAMLVTSQRPIYSEGETVQAVGSTPDAVGFITEGELTLTVTTDNGQQLTVAIR